MTKLTSKQQSIYEYIEKYIKKNGYAPSVRDISEHFEMTTKGAYDHLQALKKKDYITMSDKISRSIVITKKELTASEKLQIYDVIRWFVTEKKNEHFTEEDIDMLYDEYMDR